MMAMYPHHLKVHDSPLESFPMKIATTSPNDVGNEVTSHLGTRDFRGNPFACERKQW